MKVSTSATIPDMLAIQSIGLDPADAEARTGASTQELPRIALQTDGQRRVDDVRCDGSATVKLGLSRSGFDAFIARHSSTPFAVTAAIFLTLLYRHTRQNALMLGVFERTAPERSARTNVLRVDFTDDLAFGSVVEQVDRQLTRDVSRGSQRGGNMRFGWDVTGPQQVAASVSDEVELVATVAFADDGLELHLCYDSKVFSSSRVQEFGNQFAILANQVLVDPNRTLLQYSLVTDRGRETMPNPRDVLERPRQTPIVDKILEWATLTPNAPAIRHATRDFTYGELNEYSRSVALQLRAQSVEVGDVVAVTGERCAALVGAMVGIFRSGAVLLTLDPKMPSVRRRTMLEKARARLLVRVGFAGQDIVLEGLGLTVIDLDARGGMSALPSPGNSDALPVIDTEQAAYVFYTSGSTGAPKGVKGTHAGLAHFLGWQRDQFGVGPSDRASQLTALSFDVVLRDMFLALTSGATLCIPAESDVLDPSKIFRWLEREEITTIHIVPSLARMWLNYLPPGITLPNLRRVFFAGEPLTDVLVARWHQAFPGGCEVINLYGPTETTLAKCFYRVPPIPQVGVQSVGRTLPQTQVLILNAERTLCGLHEAGEIAIRTPFRTLGYVDNAQANAKVFIQNPFNDRPDDLIYLTGDCGRYGTDGLIEILGRLDNQVKIRGVRIELAEIEACLGLHPSVRDAVVVALESESGDLTLVAYVVSKIDQAEADPAARASVYRRHLRERLPESMVPSAFVSIDALPLNANGKVDKKALPPPERVTSIENVDVGPQGDMQMRVACVWSAVLNVHPIDVDANFFDMGGHSLMAIQLVRAVERELGRSCPLPLLFNAPTVRSLCTALERGEVSEGAVVIPLQQGGTGPALYCICGVHLYQALAKELSPDISAYGIFLPVEQALFETDSQQTSRVEPTLETMAQDYVGALRQHQPTGPYLLAGVSFGGVLAYEMAQQLTSAGEEVTLVALLDSMLPTAIRRDWFKWSGEQFRQFRLHGPSLLVEKLRARARHWFRGARSSPAVDASRQADPSNEVDRLGAVRQAVYARATRAYVPHRSSIPTVLMRALDTGFFRGDIADTTYGWGALIDNLQIVDVPGDHLGILAEPHVRTLATQLRPHLDRARLPVDAISS